MTIGFVSPNSSRPTGGFAPSPRLPQSYDDVIAKQREREIIIAKSKPKEERTSKDKLLLAADTINNMNTVCYMA